MTNQTTPSGGTSLAKTRETQYSSGAFELRVDSHNALSRAFVPKQIFASRAAVHGG